MLHHSATSYLHNRFLCNRKIQQRPQIYTIKCFSNASFVQHTIFTAFSHSLDMLKCPMRTARCACAPLNVKITSAHTAAPLLRAQRRRDRWVLSWNWRLRCTPREAAESGVGPRMAGSIRPRSRSLKQFWKWLGRKLKMLLQYTYTERITPQKRCYINLYNICSM